MTFAPPPGRNESRFDHDYAGDFEAWLDAIEAWAARTEEATIEVASTRSRKTIRVGAEAWRTRIEEEVATAWWERTVG